MYYATILNGKTGEQIWFNTPFETVEEAMEKAHAMTKQFHASIHDYWYAWFDVMIP